MIRRSSARRWLDSPSRDHAARRPFGRASTSCVWRPSSATTTDGSSAISPPRDFEVFDGGKPRAIADFRQEIAGLSVALLFDVSGSMEGPARPGPRGRVARCSALSTRARRSRRVPVRHAPRRGRAVYDWPAAAARRRCRRSCRLARRRFTTRSPEPPSASPTREGRRHAVVVFTDGFDNASTLTAGAGVRHREFHRRPGVHRRRRVGAGRSDVADGRRPLQRIRRLPARSPTSRRGPAAGPLWPARPPSAASSRGRSSTNCAINT